MPSPVPGHAPPSGADGARPVRLPAAGPDAPAVAADIDLVIDYGGHTGTVVDLAESAAVIRVGSAQLNVPFGSPVRARTDRQTRRTKRGPRAQGPAGM